MLTLLKTTVTDFMLSIYKTAIPSLVANIQAHRYCPLKDPNQPNLA